MTDGIKADVRCRGSRYCQEYIQLSEEAFRQRQEDAAEAKRLLAKGYDSDNISASLKRKQEVKKKQQSKAESTKTQSNANTKKNNIKLPNGSVK